MSGQHLATLKQILSDFKTDPKCGDPYAWGEHSIDISKDERADLPAYAVFLALVRFHELPFAGRSEKIAWSVPILFRGVPYVVSHQKFGFGIFPRSTVATPEYNKELIKKLRNAVR